MDYGLWTRDYWLWTRDCGLGTRRAGAKPLHAEHFSLKSCYFICLYCLIEHKNSHNCVAETEATVTNLGFAWLCVCVYFVLYVWVCSFIRVCVVFAYMGHLDKDGKIIYKCAFQFERISCHFYSGNTSSTVSFVWCVVSPVIYKYCTNTKKCYQAFIIVQSKSRKQQNLHSSAYFPLIEISLHAKN